MKLIDAYYTLKALNIPILHTNDVAAYLKISTPHASKLLSRLAQSKHMVHLKKGLWAFLDNLDPLMLPEYLTNPLPSYVSLHSALYYHGMVSQIPTVIYAVSLAKTRRFQTTLGTISVHHIQPDFFFGFESTKQDIKMATPEKALLDFLYLGPARSKLFRTLTEIEWPENFSVTNAYHMIQRIKSKRRRTLVKNRFEKLLSNSPD